MTLSPKLCTGYLFKDRSRSARLARLACMYAIQHSTSGISTFSHGLLATRCSPSTTRQAGQVEWNASELLRSVCFSITHSLTSASGVSLFSLVPDSPACHRSHSATPHLAWTVSVRHRNLRPSHSFQPTGLAAPTWSDSPVTPGYLHLHCSVVTPQRPRRIEPQCSLCSASEQPLCPSLQRRPLRTHPAWCSTSTRTTASLDFCAAHWISLSFSSQPRPLSISYILFFFFHSGFCFCLPHSTTPCRKPPRGPATFLVFKSE